MVVHSYILCYFCAQILRPPILQSQNSVYWRGKKKRVWGDNKNFFAQKKRKRQKVNIIPQQLQIQWFCHLYLLQKHAAQHKLVQTHPCPTFSLFCTLGNHQPEPAPTKPRNQLKVLLTQVGYKN